jgi:type III secretion protein J
MKKISTHRLRWILLLLFGGFLAGCTMEIQHGLSEREANEILVLLSKSQPAIEATKLKDASGREVKWTIVVSKSDAPRAISILQAQNLPRRKEKGLKELYSQTGMIPTETQERARLMMAISGDLNRTLKSISGVLKAKVLAAIPKEKSILRPGEKPPSPTASVFLLVNPGQFKTMAAKKVLEQEATKLVLGSIPRILRKDVHIVIRDGGFSAPMGGKSTDGGGAALRRVLFVRVEASDAMKLKALMFGGFGLIGVLGIMCLLLFFRASSLKQQLNANSL